MNEFKVGDRVKLIKKGGAWCTDNYGKTGTISRIYHKWTYVAFNGSKGSAFENEYGSAELLELTHTHSP